MSSLLKVSCLSFCMLLIGCGPSESEIQLEQGKEIVNANCKVCHAQGINGAPILGNKKMWSSRTPQGKDILIEHAMNGYGLMPAKGGNTELTQEEIDLAITYMLSLLN